MSTADATSTTGRTLGRRGAETRQRILDTLAAMIEAHGVREIRLSEVTREVGVSPPAFYQYFKDLDEALLALCEQVSEQALEVRAALEPSWIDEAGTDAARRFVDRFIGYWDDHRPVLWVRNVAAQDGDERFRSIRNRALEPISNELTRQITLAQAAGHVDASITPASLAIVLMSMVERIGMMYPGVGSMGSSRDELVHAVSYVFERAIVGPR